MSRQPSVDMQNFLNPLCLEALAIVLSGTPPMLLNTVFQIPMMESSVTGTFCLSPVLPKLKKLLLKT